MDFQLFIACIFVAVFAGAVAGYIARDCEKDWQRDRDDTESGVGGLQ